MNSLDWFIREHEAGDDEEDVYHGPTREDETKVWQLDPPRWALLAEAIGWY